MTHRQSGDGTFHVSQWVTSRTGRRCGPTSRDQAQAARASARASRPRAQRLRSWRAVAPVTARASATLRPSYINRRTASASSASRVAGPRRSLRSVSRRRRDPQDRQDRRVSERSRRARRGRPRDGRRSLGNVASFTRFLQAVIDARGRIFRSSVELPSLLTGYVGARLAGVVVDVDGGPRHRPALAPGGGRRDRHRRARPGRRPACWRSGVRPRPRRRRSAAPGHEPRDHPHHADLGPGLRPRLR
jgi:hypothetical protein